MTDLFKKTLHHLFLTLDLPLNDRQLWQFSHYQEELLSWNEKINLTALTEEKEIIIKHFYDSVLGLKCFRWTGQERVLDLGSGAGFPGIPLKLVSPNLSMTLVDSLQKRVKFLQHLVSVLSLSGIEAVHGRAEELGQDKDYREKFDVVVSRAVAELPVLAEYCLPFVRPGGFFLAYKGFNGQQEYEKAISAIEKVGGELFKIKSFSLPENMGERKIIVLKKVKVTPATYPRRTGIPSKKPL